ncbi:MAG: R3H domain-containing nucleic acid-binding protein [Parcubacteria group bacterium]|jgi:spoIIIJ-associated protein
MERELLEKEVVTIVEELIGKMGFEATVTIKNGEEEGKDVIICDIRTEDSNFLIGQYGLNLQSLQHIVRVMMRKRIEEPVNFILDVNSYRQEKNESIVRLAKNLAEEVVAGKKEIVMRPMTAYERRIVHMELSKNELIKTESIGEGESRRIVVKPMELA